MKEIQLYNRDDAKMQAEQWMRYSEDFMRRFIDPVGVDPAIARCLFVLMCYVSSAILIITLF